MLLGREIGVDMVHVAYKRSAAYINDLIDKLSRLGMDPATGTAEEFAKILAADYAKWGPIVKRSDSPPTRA